MTRDSQFYFDFFCGFLVGGALGAFFCYLVFLLT